MTWLLWPVLGTISFVWAMHRYVEGNGPDWSLGSLRWVPPATVVPFVVMYAVAAVGLTLSLRDRRSAPTVEVT